MQNNRPDIRLIGRVLENRSGGGCGNRLAGLAAMLEKRTRFEHHAFEVPGLQFFNCGAVAKERTFAQKERQPHKNRIRIESLHHFAKPRHHIPSLN